MKTKMTLLIAFLFLGLTTSFAQDNEACNNNLSLFTEAVKSENCKEAYPYYQKAIQDCPKYNQSAIYKYGEDMLDLFIESTTGEEKKRYINELVGLWESRMVNYASKSPRGKYASKIAELRYDNRELLGLTDEQIYNEFDAVYKSDLKNFNSPKGLYVYFKMMVNLYDAGKKTPQQLFDKYDDVVEKLETEVRDNSADLNKIVVKEEAGTPLTKKDGQYKRFYEQTLSALEKISGSVDSELGDRANCENLIPLYKKDYEANKNNAQWLQRAMNNLYAKECKEDPMFVKIVKQKYSLEPNADTARYLYVITGEQKYLDETFRLETNPIKKAVLYYKQGNDYKSKGNYSQARNYYMKSVELNPSNRKPYLQIASMYANSAKDCGTDAFSQRAVYWLAAQEAEKGGSSSAAASYRGYAPTKVDIFNKNMNGKVIRIGCWIQRSVTVPN